MAKFKLPGISASEGMRQMDYTTFPEGEYLLKVTEVEVTDKTNEKDEVTGSTFQIKSEVLGAEKLPATEEVRDYVGKTFTDFIFVMSPAHPSYANTTKIGGLVGEIGLASLKSFLDSVGVVIKNDEFDEKKAVGKWLEVRMGIRGWKDRDGNDRKGNQVYEYRAHVDEGAVADEVAEVKFEDDDLV